MIDKWVVGGDYAGGHWVERRNSDGSFEIMDEDVVDLRLNLMPEQILKKVDEVILHEYDILLKPRVLRILLTRFEHLLGE
jgi:hypothetical protein